MSEKTEMKDVKSYSYKEVAHETLVDGHAGDDCEWVKRVDWESLYENRETWIKAHAERGDIIDSMDKKIKELEAENF